MNASFKAFIALFFAIDYLYDQHPCDTTGLCAGELNPFLWKAVGSADPAHYLEFKQEYATRFPEKTPSETEGFEFVREYAARLSSTFHGMFPSDETIVSLFDRHIDQKAWAAIWERAGVSAAKRLEELNVD